MSYPRTQTYYDEAPHPDNPLERSGKVARTRNRSIADRKVICKAAAKAAV
jgi:neutral trehalase